MQNEGVELAVGFVPVLTKDLKWDIDFNLANNHNRITSLPNHADIASGSFIFREGVPFNTFYLREYAGVNPDNGDPLWYQDITHTTKANVYPAAGARILAGQALPKYFGSLSTSVKYKDFTVSAQFYYNFGNQVYDTWRGYYLGSGNGPTFNKVVRQLDRWTEPGQVTDIPKYVYGGIKSFSSASTFNLASGDFIRLRDIQVAYNVPKSIIEKAKISNANIYIRGTNLFTWVKDKNLPFDPEQGTTASSNLNVFIPKTVTFGINLSF